MSAGKPDDFKLWLHLKGPIPEGSQRTVDFVPFSQEAANSWQSDNSLHQDVGLEETVFKRDRDSDLLTA